DAVGTPKNVQLPVRSPSRANRVTPYQMKKIQSRSPGPSAAERRAASHRSTRAPAIPDSDSYRNSGWKWIDSGKEGEHAYWAIRWAQSILIPHGRAVGGPYSS